MDHARVLTRGSSPHDVVGFEQDLRAPFAHLGSEGNLNARRSRRPIALRRVREAHHRFVEGDAGRDVARHHSDASQRAHHRL